MRDEDDAIEAGGIKAIAKLPIFLHLHGRKAALAGETPGLAWKAELTAAAGADVVVFAPRPCDELRALARRGVAAGSLRIEEREWAPEDLKGAAIAVADLHTLGEAAAFKEAGVAAGVIVNTVDKGATCDFYFGAVVSRTPLMIGATTDGTAPILGQSVRRAIELAVPDWLGPWLDWARAIRPEVKRRLAPGAQRRGFWEAFTERAWATPLDEAGKAALMNAIEGLAATDKRGGSLARIAAPAHVDDLRLGDVKRLQAADLIIEERGAKTAARAFFRREATRLVIGRANVAGEVAPEAVEAMMAQEVAEGRRVVLLTAA
jgi:uroporphyrin-III C-methyltransferase/precorrin-2 dehydrogenase/sirohydrochlorin ferrochelatase